MQNPLANFHTLSPEQRKALILILKKRGIDVGKLPIASVGRDAALPLSYGQQRLWFLAQLEPDSSAYHIADAVYLHGAIDADALQHSLDKLVVRHESLRTTFCSQDGKPVQTVHDPLPVTVQWLDLSGEPGDPDALAKRHVEHLEREPFDLQNGPLLRVAVLTLAAERHVLVWVLHHIVADEWSLNILLNEFAELYHGCCAGREPALPGLPIGYADFAVWQRHWLEAGETERQLAYWRDRLDEENPPLELPLDRPRPAQMSDTGAKLEHAVPDAVAAELRTLCQSQGATLFMGLLTLFKMLLYRYSGQGKLRVGVPIANRNRRETEQLVGFFVNTQVLQTELDGSLNFYQALQRVKETALGAQAHADLPFDQLVEALSPQRSLDRNPLFEVMFNHQYQQADTARALGALHIEPFPREAHTTQFELILDTFESVDGGIAAVWTYATDVRDEAMIRRMARHFCRLAEVAALSPETALRELPLLDPAERELLIQKPSFFCQFVDLPALIRRQAALRPEAVALIVGAERWRYAELQGQADRLARHLLDQGLRPGAVVGLNLPRSAAMLVASLAVWHCGAAFLALDPGYPVERLQAMLDDADAGWLLSGKGGTPGLPAACRSRGGRCRHLDLDRLDLTGDAEAPPASVRHPDQIAYLIYTSGSTGKPKGVAVGHGALAQQAAAMADLYGLQPGETCLHFAAFSFDAAIEQWVVPLRCGATLVLGDPAQWSVEHTLHTLRAQAITRLDMPPAYLTELARQLDRPDQAPSLTSCTVGGEALPRDSLALIQARLRPGRLFNAYGPTECVITPLVWTAEATCAGAYAPIGSCVGARTAYVLDADLNPLPAGAAGELYIGGLGLAQGYWRQPGQSAERFLPDPFAADGGRMYRTGDRVRQRPDGVIDYLGRVDQQIKLRGFRIEPGEIESALRAQPGVTAAAVVVGTHGQLLGYVAADPAAALDGEALRGALSRHLPEYLLPAQILVLPGLPQLPNGKLDRKALPEPTRLIQPGRAPRNAVERQLAQIWQDVLSLDAVGVEDNFFELGGHSLLALRLVSTINRRLGWEMPLSRLLQQPTIAALAAQRNTTTLSPLVALNTADGPLPPLFCLHPAGGTVFGYYPLARALAGQRPVFGLLCRSFLDSEWRDVSLESMARDYAEAIAQRQPEGPIHLLGWSLGGALALSMARVLEQAGREIAFLGLADCFVPGFEQDEAEDDGSDSLRELLRDLSPDLADAAPEALAKLPASINGTHPAADWVKLLDLQNGLAIMHHLTELSEQYRIEPIKAGMHCWWSRPAGEAAELAQDILEQACDNRLLGSARIDSDHSGIVRHLDFMGEVIAILQRKADARR
jgi:amino acid adenylation domain-containing protein